MIPGDAIIQPGDELIEVSGYGYPQYNLVKAKHVTPSGQIVLEDGRRYRKDGERINGDKWARSSLELATPELLSRYTRQLNIGYLNGVSWRNLPDKTLDQIAKLVRGAIDTK